MNHWGNNRLQCSKLFTVNLANCGSGLLTEQIGLLREVRQMQKSFNYVHWVASRAKQILATITG